MQRSDNSDDEDEYTVMAREGINPAELEPVQTACTNSVKACKLLLLEIFLIEFSAGSLN